MEKKIKNNELLQTVLSVGDVRKGILAVEDKILNTPGSMLGDCFPLRHFFVDGAYVREITMPKGALLTSKIHKLCHPYFVLKGDVSVLTEDGVIRIKAPYFGITKPGTKRVLYMHEETVWVTVHVTNETDLKKIEDEIIAKTFDEVPGVDDAEVVELLGEIGKEGIK